MKKDYFFLLCLFLCLFINSQQNKKTQRIETLEALQNELLQKDYLFKNITKNNFKTEINTLKNTISQCNKTGFYWKINSLLSKFKITNLYATNLNNTNQFPFKIKIFNNKCFLTQITKKYGYLLSNELVKVNDLTIKEIINKLKGVFYLPHENLENKILEKHLNNKSLLNYLSITKKDTLELTFISKNKKKQLIYLPLKDSLSQLKFIKINTKKKLFNQRKSKTWFWIYGINFGQQVYFKYNVCSSKEHINKMKDSLNFSTQDYAKAYNLSLQSVYDAKKINPFINKLVKRFKKRRYKKLIIDFRNNTKGSFLSAKKLLLKISKIKRINKKRRFYILTNSNINGAAIATILALKKNKKIKVIGEKVFGTKEDSNTNKKFLLLNSQITINYPTKIQKEIIINPDVLVKKTLQQYLNNVDAILQNVLK